MELQVAHGISSMLSRGSSEQAGRSLRRGLELANQLGDHLNELRTLGRLSIFHHRAGDFRAALEYAERCVVVAKNVADPISLAEANASLGALLHLKGDFAAARFRLEAALVELPTLSPINTLKLGYNYRSRARITLAGVLWMEGSYRQAHAVTRQAVEEAEAFGHLVTSCMVLIAAMDILLRDGDLDTVERYAERLIENADEYSLAPYQAVARGVKGELLARRGQPDLGVAQLRGAVAALHGLRYEWLTAKFLTAIANGLAIAGHFGDAMKTIDEAIAVVERNGDLFTMPEMLRVKGSILMLSPDPQLSVAEDYFLRSLDLAAQQGALAWELRTATSLARLQAGRGERNRAKNTLVRVYDRFTDDFDNADLIAARSLLSELS
jgi:tetratricopeptide (TPR) repeat protein